jgi:hypothetical protein
MTNYHSTWYEQRAIRSYLSFVLPNFLPSLVPDVYKPPFEIRDTFAPIN